MIGSNPRLEKSARQWAIPITITDLRWRKDRWIAERKEIERPTLHTHPPLTSDLRATHAGNVLPLSCDLLLQDKPEVSHCEAADRTDGCFLCYVGSQVCTIQCLISQFTCYSLWWTGTQGAYCLLLWISYCLGAYQTYCIGRDPVTAELCDLLLKSIIIPYRCDLFSDCKD